MKHQSHLLVPLNARLFRANRPRSSICIRSTYDRKLRLVCADYEASLDDGTLPPE